MNLSKAIEFIDEGINLDAARRKIQSTKKMCDALLDDIDRQQREQQKSEAQKRMEVYKTDEQAVRVRSAIKTAYLESFKDIGISHWFCFMRRLTYEGIELKLTEQDYNRIRKENKGDLVGQLNEIIKHKL